MHCQNIEDGRYLQKIFFLNILQTDIYFEPFLTHSLVSTVFDLET